MIKLKDLLLETPSNRAMRDSKKGASKQFLRDNNGANISQALHFFDTQ